MIYEDSPRDMLRDVVDEKSVGGDLMCVSTRERNRFPSVLFERRTATIV